MQLDDINIFDYKAPTPEEILAAGPGATATPIDPYERFQQERSQLSLDPVKRTLQRAGQGLGSLFAVETPLDYALSGLAAAKPVVAAGKGIAALTRPVFPAPQRMFDPANKGYNPSLSDFGYEPGGRYLQMGKDKTDITGQIPQAGRISVGPDGKPSFMVSADLAESLPNTGKIIRTNLFKKKAGWKWTKTPEGFDPNPASDFPIVSVETGNKHYYTLATDFPDGVELSRYAKKTSEPRLRPTTKGEINLGQKVGEISVRGKKHPVYDQITAGKIEPKDLVFVHNTSEEAIKSFDNMGGIPSPSIAVTKGDQSFTGFGKIQLIGRPEKFDPLVDPRNKIYSADAYTPRAPKKLRLAKPGADKQIAKDYAGIEINYGNADEILEQGEYALRNLQKDNFYYPENRLDELDRFFYSPLARRKYAKEKGLGDEVFDPNLKPDNFKDYSVNEDFQKWARKQKDKYLSQDGVLQYFDDAKETMVTQPYTLENAVNSMIKETQRGGESASTAFGPGSMRALMSREFADLPDLKSESARISSATSSSAGLGSEIGSLLDKYNFPDKANIRVLGSNMLNDVGIALSDGKKFDEDLLKDVYNRNIDFDYVQNIRQGFKYDEPPKGFLDDLEKIFVENATGNVRYFEAKPTRAVGFDEFAGAIVPPNTSKEVINILEKRGLKVLKETDDDIENMAFDAGEMATNLRQKHFKEQFFSMAPIAAGASATAMMEEEDRGIGSL